MQTQSAVTLTETRGKKMELKTKTEMLAMTQEQMESHSDEAWAYFEKVKAVREFMKLED